MAGKWGCVFSNVLTRLKVEFQKVLSKVRAADFFIGKMFTFVTVILSLA